jgi:hypothetical protein
MIKIEKNMLVWTCDFGYAVSNIIQADGIWELYVKNIYIFFMLINIFFLMNRKAKILNLPAISCMFFIYFILSKLF